jgi:D-arabinose 1-dehydrogenase-like Zn-dependent alcohol dehydrogenase
MKAVGLYRYLPIDHPESFIDVELPRPEPGPRDLLVRVMAVSVNPVDTKVRSPKEKVESEPRVLGWDVGGSLRFRVQGSGFRVHGSRFTVRGSGVNRASWGACPECEGRKSLSPGSWRGNSRNGSLHLLPQALRLKISSFAKRFSGLLDRSAIISARAITDSLQGISRAF